MLFSARITNYVVNLQLFTELVNGFYRIACENFCMAYPVRCVTGLIEWHSQDAKGDHKSNWACSLVGAGAGLGWLMLVFYERKTLLTD